MTGSLPSIDEIASGRIDSISSASITGYIPQFAIVFFIRCDHFQASGRLCHHFQRHLYAESETLSVRTQEWNLTDFPLQKSSAPSARGVERMSGFIILEKSAFQARAKKGRVQVRVDLVQTRIKSRVEVELVGSLDDTADLLRSLMKKLEDWKREEGI